MHTLQSLAFDTNHHRANIQRIIDKKDTQGGRAKQYLEVTHQTTARRSRHGWVLEITINYYRTSDSSKKRRDKGEVVGNKNDREVREKKSSDFRRRGRKKDRQVTTAALLHTECTAEVPQ